MGPAYYVTCLWPGMAELWWRGRLSAIPTAVAFTAALNTLLVMRYLYPEWLSSGLVRLAFWIGTAVWLFFVIRNVRELPALIMPRSVSKEPDQFPRARQAYLSGNWSEAEGLLTDLLAIEPRDPPSLLLLCGVYRQTNRLEAASQMMAQMRLLEVADAWWLEVAAEQQRIDRQTGAQASSDDRETADLASTDKKAAGDSPVASEPVHYML